MNSRSSIKRTFATREASRLRDLSPPISAVGFGGSFGRGDADRHSDLDIFVFLDSGDLFAHGRWFKTVMAHDEPPLSVGALKFFAGYGLCVSYVFEELGKVEYFLNTPTSWTADPMRANTQVVWDRSGLYTKLVQDTHGTAAQYLAATEAAKDVALHDLLLESLNALKYAKRGDVWSLHYRIAIMRRYLVAFQLTCNHGIEFGVQNAMMRFRELSHDEQEGIKRTIPIGCADGVADALWELARASAAVASTHKPPDRRWDHCCENLNTAAQILSE